jgi:hypothetical protein
MDDKQRLARRSSSRLPSLSASATPSIRKDREALTTSFNAGGGPSPVDSEGAADVAWPQAVSDRMRPG